MKWMTASLRFRLFVIVLFALVPVMALNWYSSLEAKRISGDATREYQRQLVQVLAKREEMWIDESRLLLMSLSQAPEIQSSDVLTCNRFLSSVLPVHPEYVNFGVADMNGDIYCSALPIANPVAAADRLWFSETIRTGAFSIGEYQIGRITGVPTVNFGYPLLGPDGRVRGVVFAALRLSWINDLVAAIGLPPRNALMVIDRNAAVLARFPDPELWIGKQFGDVPAVQEIIAVGKEGTLVAAGLDGVTRLWSFTPLQQENGSSILIAYGVPVEDVWGADDAIFQRNMLVLGALALFVMGLSWLVAELFIVRQVNVLIAASKRLAAGDFSTRTGVDDYDGELGSLAKMFDDMAQTLQERQKDLVRANNALRTLSGGNRVLIHSENLTELFSNVCRHLVETGGYRMAWVGLVGEKEADRLRPVAHAGEEDGYLALFGKDGFLLTQAKGAIGAAIRTKTPSVVDDLATDLNVWPSAAEAGKRGYRSAASFPLIEHGMLIGLLTMYAGKPKAFDTETIHLLEELAADVAFGITTLREKQAHEQAVSLLEESERKHRSYVEQSMDGIFVMSDDGIILEVNSAAARMLGYTRAELAGKTCHDFTAHVGVGEHARDVLRTVIQEGRFKGDIRLKRKDGGEFVVDLRSVALGQKRNLCMFRDMTERFRGEEKLKELNELKSAFLRVVSHQLRTPLNSIRWNLESLLAEKYGKLKKEQKEFIRTTHKIELEAIQLLHDLLEALDIEEGRVSLVKKSVRLGSIWTSVFEERKAQCKAKGIVCEYRPPAKRHTLAVEADPEKVRGVFEKLFDNAFSYTPKKGKITARFLAADGRVRFEITDTGIGIPQEEQTRIFTRFYRASNASVMKPAASGLGLTIAKYVIEQHGGTIGFESEEGKGSTFWFELPLKNNGQK